MFNACLLIDLQKRDGQQLPCFQAAKYDGEDGKEAGHKRIA